MLGEAVSQVESHLVEWIQHLTEGENPLAHVAETKIQEIHSLAYLLYQKQHYQEASHFFRLIVVARPSEAKYWKGLGACLQMQKNYEEALNCYLSAQILHQDQPDPYLYVYAADCYFALKQIEAGLKVLETAHLSAEKVQDSRVLHHVALMRELWSKL